jgi:hypothetical protein
MSVAALGLLGVWVPATQTVAAAPAMSVTPGAGTAGLNVALTGSDFPRRSTIQLTWDGNPAGMPTATTSGKGGFRVKFVVPATTPGPHTIVAMAVVTSNVVAETVSSPIAAVSFTVEGSSLPTPAPSVAPLPSASPTEAPRSSPTPTPTPADTASPSPTATPIPTFGSGGRISGTIYQDLDRDGVRDVGEPPLSGHGIVLRASSGTQLATTTSDANGDYIFPGLVDGAYQVASSDSSWRLMRTDWVPTTTGSVFPRASIALLGTAVQDLGWRRLIRSSNVAAPIATYTGASGLRVETYNDAVAPEEIHRELMLGLVGVEAPFVTVRFDLNASAQTVAGWQGVPGSYSNYSAVVYAGYDSWLDGGDQALSHEYGHAWSYYYDVIVQQESNFSSYLTARGLAGDARVGTEYKWYRAEMIAEDYRELFGSPNAKLAWHLNRDIPHPDDVPGLRHWFLTSFVGMTE